MRIVERAGFGLLLASITIISVFADMYPSWLPRYLATEHGDFAISGWMALSYEKDLTYLILTLATAI